MARPRDIQIGDEMHLGGCRVRGRRLVYPLLVGYLLVVSLSIAVLVQRRPPAADARDGTAAREPPAAVPALAPSNFDAPQALPPEPITGVEEPGALWVQIFRPTPVTARLLLQRSIPLFGAGDPGLVLYESSSRPRGVLDALFPFVRVAPGSAGEGQRPATAGGSQPRVAAVSPPRTGPPAGGAGGPPQAAAPPGFAVPEAARPAVPLQTGPALDPQADAGAAGGAAPGAAAAGRAPACGPGGRAPAVAAVGGGRALVGIYHTHDYESYVSEFPDGLPPQGNWAHVATQDPERNIIRVGARLAEALCERGVTVVHSPSRNAYTYLGAYTQSLETAETILEQYPTVVVLLDLHRDDAPRELSTATVGGLPVARIAIVVGRGSEGLPQPDWRRNTGFAQTLHEAMEARYTGLSRGIILKDNRYNQHLLPGALLLEVGSAQNTMAEALRAVDLLAGVLADVLREGRYPR